MTVMSAVVKAAVTVAVVEVNAVVSSLDVVLVTIADTPDTPDIADTAADTAAATDAVGLVGAVGAVGATGAMGVLVVDGLAVGVLVGAVVGNEVTSIRSMVTAVVGKLRYDARVVVKV